MSDLSSSSPPARSFFVEEAAILLGVSRRTVYYRIRQGRLRTIHTRCGSQRVLLDSVNDSLGEAMNATRSDKNTHSMARRPEY